MSFLKKFIGSNEALLITEKSYKDFFTSHYTPLCTLIFRIVKNKDQTEDIVQEVFITLWEKRDSITIETSLKSYLYRSAINRAYTYLEKNKRYPILRIEHLENYPTSITENGERLELNELEIKIETLIQSLPEACREIFLLSRFESMSYKEIAETLLISIKTVENQLGKALRIFREGLNK